MLVADEALTNSVLAKKLNSQVAITKAVKPLLSQGMLRLIEMKMMPWFSITA